MFGTLLNFVKTPHGNNVPKDKSRDKITFYKIMCAFTLY